MARARFGLYKGRRATWFGSITASVAVGLFAVPAAATPAHSTVPSLSPVRTVNRVPSLPPEQTTNPGAGPTSITGPIPSTAAPGDPSNNYIFYATPLPLASYGYEEEEYFISGIATRYPFSPTVAQQGQAATPIGTMPYTTRIVVRRPINGAQSAGVAVVDFQNDTPGHDWDSEWGSNGDYFVQHGWTWIGASVQWPGVNGAYPGPVAGGLKGWNPTRYASLDLTDGGTIYDNSQAFDVYTQIGELAKGTSSNDPLSDLHLTHLYAGGVSGSAVGLDIYYNTIQPLAHVYDGFLLAESYPPLLPPSSGVGTKAIRVQSENGTENSLTVPDSSTLRTWEIAGAAHVPAYWLGASETDFRDVEGGIPTLDTGAALPDCPTASQVNSWAVFHAAYDALNKWVQDDISPPAGPPFVVNPDGTFAHDANGNIEGGIQLPDTAVPTALNSASSTPSTNFWCGESGNYAPFTQAQIDALYSSNQSYQQKVVADVQSLETQGFLLPEDASFFTSAATEAAQVLIPSNGATLSGTAILDGSTSPVLAGEGTPANLPYPATKLQYELTGGTYTNHIVATAVPTFYGWLAEEPNGTVGWDSTSVPNGTYTLNAVATYGDGSVVTSPGMSITVSNSAPTAQVLIPSSGATLSGTTFLDGTASDTPNITEFTYYRDGAAIGNAFPSAYGWLLLNWNTTTVANGSHTLTAVATYSDGTKATSPGVTVNISN